MSLERRKYVEREGEGQRGVKEGGERWGGGGGQ